MPLLNELVIRDIKVRYRKSFLGILWTILNPLMMMLVLVVVFSHFFRSEIDNYPVYILTGQLVFNFFSSATNMGVQSIIWNASLIKKVYVPKYLFPFSVVASCLVNFGFSTISMILVMIITRAPFYWTILAFPIPTICLVMFTLGVALILAAVSVYFRDIVHFYGVVLTAWMYFTPIFWSTSMLPDYLRRLLMFNPLYHFLRYFRLILMENTLPSLADHAVCFLMGAGMLTLGLYVFARLQDNFILHV